MNRKNGLLIFFFSTVVGLIFYHLGVRSLWGTEGRWAGIAREMLQSGNYFSNTLNGKIFYTHKPFLSYWLVCLSAFFSHGVTEWSARLPTALSGIASVAFLYLLGKRLFNSGIALLSSAILATTFYFLFWSKTANADILTIALFLLTLQIFVANEEKKTHGWLFLFYAVMAVNCLAKGLLGVVLPMAVILPYSLFNKKRDWLWNRVTPLAWLFFAAIYFTPNLISCFLVQSWQPLGNLIKENFVRYFNAFDHQQPFYIYLYGIFLLFAPWSLFLPGALVGGWQHRRNPQRQFVLLLFAAVYFFFLLSSSRRNYYLLPTLPGASLLVALFLGDWLEKPTSKKLFFFVPVILLFIVIFGAALGLIFFDAIFRKLPPLALGNIFGLALLLPAVLSLFFFCRRKWKPTLTFLVVCLFVGNAAIWGAVIPYMEQFRSHKKMMLAVKRLWELEENKSKPLYLFQVFDSNFFYLGKTAPLLETKEEVVKLFHSGKEIWLALPQTPLKNLTHQYGLKYKVILEEPKIEKHYSFMKKGKRFYLITNKL